MIKEHAISPPHTKVLSVPNGHLVPQRAGFLLSSSNKSKDFYILHSAFLNVQLLGTGLPSIQGGIRP